MSSVLTKSRSFVAKCSQLVGSEVVRFDAPSYKSLKTDVVDHFDYARLPTVRQHDILDRK